MDLTSGLFTDIDLKIEEYYLYLCATYLHSFVHIEYEFAGVTDQEDDDDGEEECHHRGVAAVAAGQFVVKLVCSGIYKYLQQ